MDRNILDGFCKQCNGVFFGGGPDFVGYKFKNRTDKDKFIKLAQDAGFKSEDKTGGSRLQSVTVDIGD